MNENQGLPDHEVSELICMGYIHPFVVSDRGGDLLIEATDVKQRDHVRGWLMTHCTVGDIDWVMPVGDDWPKDVCP